jgi:hypothetical protein
MNNSHPTTTVDKHVEDVRQMERLRPDIDARRIREPRSVQLSFSEAEDCSWITIHPLVMPAGTRVSITYADNRMVRLET